MIKRESRRAPKLRNLGPWVVSGGVGGKVSFASLLTTLCAVSSMIFALWCVCSSRILLSVATPAVPILYAYMGGLKVHI
jgi:hypothetical protein